jgi:hypothetical protein
MGRTCSKTQLEQSSAIYLLGQLIIWAEGQKPTLCHEARVEQWPYRIYPPQYQVVACIDDDVICPQMQVPYRRAATFSISNETLEAMGGVAMLHHRDGTMKVPIKVIELPEDQTKLLRETGVDGMPSPFVKSRELPFPLSLSKFLETGRGEDIKFHSRDEVGLHTATGYSESFSFTEAFHNAIANLPPDANPYPDKLTNVKVVGLGANFGGIAGLNRMYVTVDSFY